MIKRGKKAQAKVLEILIIIVIVLIILIILWNIIMSLIKKNMEINEIKAEIMTARITITDIKGDWINNINVSLKRGAETMKLINETISFIKDTKYRSNVKWARMKKNYG